MRERRLIFGVTVAVLVGLLAWAVLHSGAPAPVAASPAPTTEASRTATPDPSVEPTPGAKMPPAWLAWISGSLPSRFAADVGA